MICSSHIRSFWTWFNVRNYIRNLEFSETPGATLKMGFVVERKTCTSSLCLRKITGSYFDLFFFVKIETAASISILTLFWRLTSSQSNENNCIDGHIRLCVIQNYEISIIFLTTDQKSFTISLEVIYTLKLSYSISRQ